MLEKEFVPYKESLEVKELGFDEPCLATRDQTEFLHIKGTKKLPRGSMMYDIVNCPTFSQAFKFFRKKYGLHGMFFCPEEAVENVHTWEKWCYSVTRIGESEIFFSEYFDSPEEAELACLRKLIEITKNE